MKILVIGSGGREHALIWRFAQQPGHELYAMPGNPGMARMAQCIPTLALTPDSILTAAQNLKIDLTVVGPEAPLVAGVADLFRKSGLALLGPVADAARLEGSKVYAKRFFEEHSLPTARFATASSEEEAIQSLAQFSYPLVVKADGLASGKGVTIANDETEARHAIATLGPSLVIEEFLQGKEISFIVLTDGRNIVPLLPSRDHKRALDGDKGPNTGGMGAYCDPALLTPEQAEDIVNRIIRPTVAATGFTGFLYAGLMMTTEGPKLLEYNVRLGDPETQALLHSLDCNLAEVLLAAATGNLPAAQLPSKPGASVTVVLAAQGYPGTPRIGDAITGIEQAEKQGAVVFHAGTRVGWSGYVTAGGRVVGVTAGGDTLEEAAATAYRAVEEIRFPGMHYRRDIGRPR